MDYYGGHQGDTKSLDYSSREEPSQVLVSSSIHAVSIQRQRAQCTLFREYA